MSFGTDRETGDYVISGAMFPADLMEVAKTAKYPSTDTIAITDATLVLEGYRGGYRWNFTPSKAGTLYNAETGAEVLTLSANQKFEYKEEPGYPIRAYYFK